MNVDDVIEEIITDLAAGLIDASDEEIAEKLAKYNLSPEDMDDVMQTIQDVRDTEAAEDIHAAGEDLDKVDIMADAQAMANADNTPVTVTEEDKDSDGDTDKVTIEQDHNENDDEFTEEDRNALTEAFNALDEEDNSSEEADKPHDEENSTNQIAKHLSNYPF